MSLKYRPNSKIKSSIQKNTKANVYQPTWLSSKMNLPNSKVFVGVTIQEDEKLKPKKKSQKVVINGFEGCICAKCQDFYPYAEPNMDDGSMVCYSCRNPWIGFAKG